MLGCCNFSNNCARGSGVWIWGNRGGLGGNCEGLVLSVPGDVRDFLYLGWRGRGVP